MGTRNELRAGLFPAGQCVESDNDLNDSPAVFTEIDADNLQPEPIQQLAQIACNTSLRSDEDTQAQQSRKEPAPPAAPERSSGAYYANTVRAYLRQIAKIPILTAEQEVELATEIEAGVFAQEYLDNHDYTLGTREELEQVTAIGSAAKKRMIESNLQLVVSIAKNFSARKSMQLLDYVGEGNIGLIRAVEKFDHTKGYKFSTYATWLIRDSIMRERANKDDEIRLPVHMYAQVSKVSKTMLHNAITMDDIGDESKIAFIADQTSLSMKAVHTAIAAIRQLPISLQTPVTDGSAADLGELIEDASAINPEAAAIDTIFSHHEVLHTVFSQYMNQDSQRAGVQALILNKGLTLNSDFFDEAFIQEHAIIPGQPYMCSQIAAMLGTSERQVGRSITKTVKMLRSPDIRKHLMQVFTD